MKATMGVALLLGLMMACGAQATSPPLTKAPRTTEAPARKNATYWVTFSTNVRPGQTMSFNVLIMKGSSPVTVTASLLDSKGKKVILQSVGTTCIPGDLKVISLEIPTDVEKPSPQRWDTYQVRVVGEGTEVNFKDEGYARLLGQAFSTFIQTDKGIYKPNQEVKIRVVSINSQLQVMRYARYDVVVKDAKNNRILHLRDVDASADLGVVQASFRLADNIPIGDWTIEATASGFTTTKTFTVSDYVLPKFEVEIDAPAFGVITDSFLNFTVKAKYSFGKPVSDSGVEVVIKLSGYDWFYTGRNPRIQPVITLSGMLNRDGQYEGSVPIESLLRLARDYNPKTADVEWQNFVINATVTEAQTDKTRFAEHVLQYYATPVKMEFLPITPKSYKAGLTFTAYLEVRQRDGSLFTPEEARNISIKFNVTYDENRGTTESPPTPPTGFSDSTDSGTDTTPGLIALEERAILPGWDYPTVTRVLTLPKDVTVQTLPDSGWLVIKFGIPLSAVRIRISAESDTPYGKADHAHFYGEPAHSPSESFLQLNVTNHKPKVNDKVIVKAKATEAMKALNYQLTAKGILLQSKRVTPSTPSKEIEFEFLAESTMSPNLNLLAFFEREDGEIVNDALSLSVEGLFANSVEVKFSKEKVKPGEDVDIVVKAKKNSMVFLLAVDKSVKWLKSGNDITQELVRQELLKYEGGDNYISWRYMFICGWPSYNSGSDAASVFSSAGVQVLTDGLVYSKPYFNPGRPDMVYFMSGRGGMIQDSMPVASQRMAGSSDSPLKTKTRRIFPENWLWSAFTTSSDGEVRVNLTAPDTITSWVASAFSSHPTDGLSVGGEPAEVITFKDLFVSLDLPSFIVRNETFCFTATVFSYYNMEVPVWVTMEKSSDFSGLYTTRVDDTVKPEKDKLYFNTILGLMKEGDIKSTKFCFTPEVLGTIAIRVSAKTNITGLSDVVEHKLRVKPEGVPHSITRPYLVSLQNGQWSENVPILFPPRTVPGSEKITINVAGNFLASVFENMDDLVKQPYGCGEQNMINFAPLISLLKFFTVSNKLTPEIEKKILDFMSQGYQRELTYEHGTSGGYSAFGARPNGNDSPSTWLSAFVLKCFAQAHQLGTPFTDVNVITRSALWLSKHNRKGGFEENGKVFNKRLQGGSGSDKAITAYSIIALHEAAKALGQNSSAYNSITISRDRGITYLEAILDQLTDPYDVCITAYALHLVDSKHKDTIFNKMEQLAKTSGGQKHWERAEEKPTHVYYWTRQSTALSIEMTSYALLAYIERGSAMTDGLGIINWLSQQKNANGGFISTQDTVIGIEALANILSEARYIPMTITVNTGTDTKTFDMNEENEMLLQKFEAPYESVTNTVSLQANAMDPTENTASTVLVEVALDFNVEDESESDVYQLKHTFNDNVLNLRLSTINGGLAGMTMVDIELPSGYGVEENSIEELNSWISRVEWKKEDVISLYFHTDVVGPRSIRVRVPFVKTGGDITNSKPKSIKVYSYYEPDSKLEVSYSLTERDFCDVVNDFGQCAFVKQWTIRA